MDKLAEIKVTLDAIDIRLAVLEAIAEHNDAVMADYLAGKIDYVEKLRQSFPIGAERLVKKAIAAEFDRKAAGQ